METPYARVTEIREATTSDEANECLGSGFVLIKALEKRETDPIGRQTSSIVYVLGRLKGNGNGTRRQADPDPVSIMDGGSSVDPAVLAGRPWKKYGSGEGEWTFVVDQDGSRLPELEPAKAFLEMLGTGEDLTVGGYRYRLRGKFLKRFPTNGQSA